MARVKVACRMRALAVRSLLVWVVLGASVACAPAPLSSMLALPEAQVAPPTTAQVGPAVARRFWVRDQHYYFSDWYAGKHRKMIDFSCTRAPYYGFCAPWRSRQGRYAGG